jgi:hypothetical protein
MSTPNQALEEVRTLCRRVLGAEPAANEAAGRGEEAHAAMLESSVCYRAWQG